MNKTKDEPTYLCGTCSHLMCDDCKSIAEEYEHLLKARTQALANAEHELEKANLEIKNLQRRAQMWEQISKAGVPEIILAWMDKEFERLVLLPYSAEKRTS